MEKHSSAIPTWANTNLIFRLGFKTVRMLKNEGLGQTLFAARYVTKRAVGLRKIKKEMLTRVDAKTGEEFKIKPLISIITPVYNTDPKMLREMMESVQGQTYPNWQLCLADGSDLAHSYVGEIIRGYASADKRIKYIPLGKNNGISGNTNAAIKASDGEYIALLDHDDMLVWSSLYEVVKTINEHDPDFIYTDEALFSQRPTDSRTMHFKPDYSPDYLNACNYICHLSVIRRSILDKVGMYDAAFDGSQDFDFTLRVTETTDRIYHIDKPLYLWRVHEGSVASDISAKDYAYDAARRAVQAHIDRVGPPGKVVYSKAVPMMRVIYNIPGNPLVSIIIPTCDHFDVLERCVDSVLEKSTYQNYEIILCENNSKDPATFAGYDRLLEKDGRIKLIKYVGPFNFSAINNFARKSASGSHLLFLNNDIQVITPDWLEEMVMFTQRPDVGACGIKLLYPNNTVQHGGIGVGLCGSAANLCPMFPREHEGFLSRLAVASNMSACTAACLMIKASAFDGVGGYDENLAVSFNDVDICLKLRAENLLVVFNPVAEAYHFESVSRGYDKKGAKKERMEREKQILRDKWPVYFSEEDGDPYYNRNFGRNSISYDV